MTPQRIQRQRTKGWRMPAGAIYVGRPSPWGNPYKVGDPDPMLIGGLMTAQDALRNFRWAVEAAGEIYLANVRAELGGHDLACWCAPGAPCHADVLLEIANQ